MTSDKLAHPSLLDCNIDCRCSADTVARLALSLLLLANLLSLSSGVSSALLSLYKSLLLRSLSSLFIATMCMLSGPTKYGVSVPKKVIARVINDCTEYGTSLSQAYSL